MNLARLSLRVLGMAYLVCLLAAIPAAAQGFTNLIYTNGNIPVTGQSAIYGFANDGTGHLTALPGSPYMTGGTGVAYGNATDAQWDSDNEIITNAAHTLMFAVNGGSNSISVFNINADGSLTPVGGSPFNSMGAQPGSLALKENTISLGVGTLVVANKNSDPLQNGGVGIPSYTTFTVSAAGVLTFNAGSTLNFPAGHSLGGIYPYPGKVIQVFTAEFMNATVGNYTILKSGILKQNTSLTLPAPKSGVPAALGGALNPLTGKNFFYVTEPVEHEVNIIQYKNTGVMTYLRQVGNLGGAVCWETINAAGTRLVTGETPSSTFTLYDISAANTAKSVQRSTLTATTGGQSGLGITGAAPSTPRYDVTGNFLYFLDRNGYVHILNVNADSSVTETLSPFDIGTNHTTTVPLGLAVFGK